jgi:hypothetical protein
MITTPTSKTNTREYWKIQEQTKDSAVNTPDVWYDWFTGHPTEQAALESLAKAFKDLTLDNFRIVHVQEVITYNVTAIKEEK